MKEERETQDFSIDFALWRLMDNQEFKIRAEFRQYLTTLLLQYNYTLKEIDEIIEETYEDIEQKLGRREDLVIH